MKFCILSFLVLAVFCRGKVLENQEMLDEKDQPAEKLEKLTQMSSDEPAKREALKPKEYVKRCDGNSCPGIGENVSDKEPKALSCVDHLKNGARNCGYYKIYDKAGNGFTVYCDMETEPGAAWTLIMSWSLKNKDIPNFKSVPLKLNAPVHENSPNWFMYRLTADRMKSIKEVSTHWRATCSFAENGINQYKDYVRGRFADADIFNFIGSGQCLKTEFVNIRGHIGIQKTAKFWQVVNQYPAHIDSSSKGCQFDPSAGALSSEDNFGFYAVTNSKFTCTKNDESTTQWWFGGYQ